VAISNPKHPRAIDEVLPGPEDDSGFERRSAVAGAEFGASMSLATSTTAERSRQRSKWGHERIARIIIGNLILRKGMS